MQHGKCANALYEVLGPAVLVVPCPRSFLLAKGALWPPKEICDELVSQGLAMRSAPILERIRPVQKSSTAASDKRPKPLDHLRSMRVVEQLEFAPRRITIVDDVITRGATLIAAVSHLQQIFPNAEVRAFGMVRTKSFEPDVGNIIDPVVGEVTFNGTDANRHP
jgi:predicted amidophosphoribosyltransferase